MPRTVLNYDNVISFREHRSVQWPEERDYFSRSSRENCAKRMNEYSDMASIILQDPFKCVILALSRRKLHDLDGAR
jgi:hypothetical protein